MSGVLDQGRSIGATLFQACRSLDAAPFQVVIQCAHEFMAGHYCRIVPQYMSVWTCQRNAHPVLDAALFVTSGAAIPSGTVKGTGIWLVSPTFRAWVLHACPILDATR